MSLGSASRAANLWGALAPPKLLSARENAVFEIELPQVKAALRLHRPGYQSKAAIESELFWCDRLATAGVAVPRPIPLPDHDLVAELEPGQFASVIAWIDGAPVTRPTGTSGDALWQAHAGAMGALLANMHRASDAIMLPAGFVRPRYSTRSMVLEMHRAHPFWEHPALLPLERGILSAAANYLVQTIGEMPQSGGAFGLVHADAVLENVLEGPAGLTLIDFDEGGWGYRLYDLACVLSQCLDEPDFPAITRALVDAYVSVHPISTESLADFILLRCCVMLAWAIPRRSASDPIHRWNIDRAVRLAKSVI